MPQVKIGVVVSVKMQKSVVVKVESLRAHALYKKKIKRSKRIKVHDDSGVKVGQKVKIIETRPISGNVHFKVQEILE